MAANPHKETMTKLTGGDEELKEAYSVEKHAENFPPCFLWYCEDDKAVPPVNSDALYRVLVENGVPAKLCAYKKGGHGLGLAYGYEAYGWFEEMIDFVKDYIY